MVLGFNHLTIKRLYHYRFVVMRRVGNGERDIRHKLTIGFILGIQ